MFQALSKPPTKVMLLGCGCSIASEATAQVSYLYNVTQVISQREWLYFKKFNISDIEILALLRRDGGVRALIVTEGMCSL